jgi:predicted  nucleic acid-binding Zn-ribbon protein
MEMSSTDKRLDDLGDRVGRFEARFERFEDKVEKRFEKIDERFEKIDEQFERLEAKIDGKLDRLTFTVWGAIAAAAVVKLLFG